jgi:hypothetical protein
MEEIMATKKAPQVRVIKKQYTRKEVLESLVYELKPFVIAAGGFASAVYFTQQHNTIAKYFSMAMMFGGLVILYWRAKDRGVIQ